ncbi:hypothetical protein [Actinokineospora inagensis]|uniref:hypothetical protein n=1 Tax=Actinokineospora inagensis TaxID=103730 RepID=UPI0004241FFD|nr:hypothetical protein [Actinokineospora inagensis]
MSEPADQPSHRVRAMLRAVADGRAQLASGREPDLYIDGVPCCDQFTAHQLTHDGLITATHGRFGELVPAVLTPAGHTAIGTVLAA